MGASQDCGVFGSESGPRMAFVVSSIELVKRDMRTIRDLRDGKR
jgi:hypothetical protein